MSRFCERNPHATEVRRSWNKGGDARMNIFAKFVKSGCDGMALEAISRFTRSSEEEDKDAGEYLCWEDLLAQYGGDTVKAHDLAKRRKSEPNGTFRVVQICV